MLINTPYFFCKKRTYNESNKMKQDKFKKMITSGEQMEEKRENIETELLEEELGTKAEIEEKEKNLPSAKKKLRKNRNFVVFLGKVVNKFPKNMFHVSLPSHKHRRVVLCYLSPRMRKNRIPILIGDTVKIRRKKNGFKKFIFFRFAPDKRAKTNQD